MRISPFTSRVSSRNFSEKNWSSVHLSTYWTPWPKLRQVAGHCRVPHCVNICCWESLLLHSADSDNPQKPLCRANCEKATDCRPKYKVCGRSKSGWSGKALHGEEQEDSKSYNILKWLKWCLRFKVNHVKMWNQSCKLMWCETWLWLSNLWPIKF